MVKSYRGMFKLKVEIKVNLPQLLSLVVAVALN